MQSLILSYLSRFVFWIFVLTALVFLYRGHNLPGGGFIAGLMMSLGFSLISLVSGPKVARKAMPVDLNVLMFFGFVFVVFSGMISLLQGQEYMVGLWDKSLGFLPLGTPVLFDLGVFFIVVAGCLKIVFVMEEY